MRKRYPKKVHTNKSVWMFRELCFPLQTYLHAKPQSFRIRTNNSYSNNYGKAMEERRSRTGFLQALMGRHPLHFMFQQNDGKCPKCGASHNFRVMEHCLLECPSVHSERMDWVSQINNLNLDMDNEMIKTSIKILNESVKPLSEQQYHTKFVIFFAFGGHAVPLNNGNLTVARQDEQYLDTSDKISLCTAEFLNRVHTKFLNK